MQKKSVIFAITITHLILLMAEVGAEIPNTSRARRSIAVLIFGQDTPHHIELHHSPRLHSSGYEYESTSIQPPPRITSPSTTTLQTPTCLTTTSTQNKKFARTFYSNVIGYRNTSNIEEYFLKHKTYIQHSATLADGVEALKERIPHLPFPPGPIEFQRVSADEDLVWIHTRRTWEGNLVSQVDILRFECGRIAEHWDIMQDTTLTDPATIVNSHPFF